MDTTKNIGDVNLMGFRFALLFFVSVVLICFVLTCIKGASSLSGGLVSAAAARTILLRVCIAAIVSISLFSLMYPNLEEGWPSILFALIVSTLAYNGVSYFIDDRRVLKANDDE